MTKQELIAKLAEATGSKKTAESALTIMLDAIQKSLKKEGGFTLVGFGSFKVAKRAARKGRNPRTGEAIKIKASKTVKVLASEGAQGIAVKRRGFAGTEKEDLSPLFALSHTDTLPVLTSVEGIVYWDRRWNAARSGPG